MTEQIQMEIVNDTSEAESEEWDLVQHKDIQISENTSDAESVEIINEEEIVETTAREVPTCSNISDVVGRDDATELLINREKDHNEENIKGTNEIQSDEINSTSTTDCNPREESIYGYFSQVDRFVSTVTAPKDAVYICLAILVVCLATLIIPEDGRIKSTFPATSPNEHEIDVANLISELRLYRESNENLKLQVKHLTEVVSGLQNAGQGSSTDNIIGTSEQFRPVKADLHPPDTAILEDINALNGLIELINIYKEFSYLPNVTRVNNENITIDAVNRKFSNNPLLNDSFGSIYNKSIQNTLDLFYKIPAHLEQLTTVVLQHKNVQPFILKWGHKLNKFSHSLQNDIRKMKLKLAKHIVKSVNGIMNSFYKKLCNFEINKVITFDECDSYNFTKNWKKNKKTVWENDKKAYKFWSRDERKVYDKDNEKRKIKVNGNREKINRIHSSEKKLSPKVLSGSDNNYVLLNSKAPVELFPAKTIEKTEEMKDRIKQFDQEFQKKRAIFGDQLESVKKAADRILKNLEKNYKNHNGNKINDNEKLKKNRPIVKETCKKSGYEIKCNETHKLLKADENWFLNIGNQRSKIRSYQSKVDWLFERARARRDKSFNENQRYFWQRHGTAPPPFSRRHRYHWFTNDDEVEF
ncbi:uncharacterized protein [Rhodnius prolixus]